MAMTIDATHWYSWDFDVTDDTRHLAHVDVSAWGEKGVLTIDGVAHRVYREGVGSWSSSCGSVPRRPAPDTVDAELRAR
jgi:hypothetical protein